MGVVYHPIGISVAVERMDRKEFVAKLPEIYGLEVTAETERDAVKEMRDRVVFALQMQEAIKRD